MKHIARLLSGILFVCLFATSIGHAQQRLFVKTSTEVIEVDTNPQSLGHVLSQVALPPDAAGSGPVSIAGGRYLAWARSPSLLVLFDTHTGVSQNFTLPTASQIVASDPSRGRVVVRGQEPGFIGQTTLTVVDGPEGRWKRLDLPPSTSIVDVAYASDAQLVFAVFVGFPAFLVHVFDADTGTRLREFRVPSFVDFVVDSAGQRAVLVRQEGAGLQYVVVDGAGNEITNAVVPRAVFEPAATVTVLDEPRRQIVTAGRNGLLFLSLDTLSVLRQVGAPRFRQDLLGPSTGAFDLQLRTDRNASALFVFDRTRTAQSTAFRPACVDSGLSAIDLNTGATLSRLSIPCQGSPIQLELVLVAGPNAPSDIRTDVVARRVTLSWTASPAATHYEVEVGLSAGLRNLGTFVVGTNDLTVDGVPSGTYHVRVRALNDAAKGPYSEEIVVVVP